MPLVSFDDLMGAAADGAYAVGYFECWDLHSLLAVADAAKEAIRAFKDAQKAIGVASRAKAAEEPAPLINPIEADRTMRALCGGRYDEGSSGFESCVADQRAAIDAMVGRSAPDVGLDATSFNVIRNNCRFEWADNYVNQDRCERTRIAAKNTLR